MEKEDRKLIMAGGFAGIFGALCCVGPVVIVALGLGSLSTALIIGKYSWLFSGLAVLFFVGAVFQYRRKRTCGSGATNWKIVGLAFILMAALLLTIKYWIAPWLAGVVY